jgi:hypothetical protein
MNTHSNQDQFFDQIEQYLTVVAALIIAAAPVYSIWALNAMPMLSPV